MTQEQIRIAKTIKAEMEAAMDSEDIYMLDQLFDLVSGWSCDLYTLLELNK